MAISIFIVALMLRPVPHTTLTPNLINLNHHSATPSYCEKASPRFPLALEVALYPPHFHFHFHFHFHLHLYEVS
jgi:hypothetical protein